MHNAVLIRIRTLTGMRDTAFYHRVARSIHEYPTRSVRLQLRKRVLVRHFKGCGARGVAVASFAIKHHVMIRNMYYDRTLHSPSSIFYQGRKMYL